jgi:hypothetical protein
MRESRFNFTTEQRSSIVRRLTSPNPSLVLRAGIGLDDEVLWPSGGTHLDPSFQELLMSDDAC